MKKKNHLFIRLLFRPFVLATLLLVFHVCQAQEQEVNSDTTAVTIESQPVEDEVIDTDDDSSFFQARLLPENIDSTLFRKANDTALAAMRADEDFWYANTEFKKNNDARKARKPFFETDAFQFILWLVIIGGFITFLIIYLHNSNAGLFRRSKQIEQAIADEHSDDIFSISYQQEIDKAIAAGNYRLGVRLLFLQLLRNLSDKSIIEYTIDRTNFDYLVQVRNASWYNLFFRLTRNYEYVWYGHFDIDREKFDVIRTDFSTLQQQLPRS